MKTVDIFGTCYTRELFNQTQDYKVQTYLKQQSIYTKDAKAYPISWEQVVPKYESNFVTRLAYYDFNKIGFSKMKENPAEYLIVDLADQIRDLYVFDKDPSIKVVFSTSNTLTLKSLGIPHHIEYFNDFSNEFIEHYFKWFTDLILSLYDKDKIVLNKVQLQMKYYEDGVKKIITDDVDIYNKTDKLEYIENLFTSLIPGVKVLTTKEEPILDINHKFGGPHGMHFDAIYYKYRMNLLDALINNISDTKSIEDDYKEEYNNSIGEIKRRVLKR